MKSLLLSLCYAIFVFQGADAVCRPRPHAFKVSDATRPPAPMASSPQNQSAPIAPALAPFPPANEIPAMQSPPPPPPVKSSPTPPPSKTTGTPTPSTQTPVPSKSEPPQASAPAPPTNPPTTTAGNRTTAGQSSLVSASAAGLCKKVDYPDLCLSSVAPFVLDSGNVGPKEMLIMQMKATVRKSADALNQVNKHLAGRITIPRLKGSLDVCKSSYQDLKAEIDQTFQALAVSDMATVKVMLSAAISDVSACEDGFAESPGLPTPMAAIDDELSKLVSNCLAFADLL